VRKKKGELLLTPLVGKVRQEHLEIATQVVAVVARSTGATREQFVGEMLALAQTPVETRIVGSFAKLIEDATLFEQDRGGAAAERREAVFARAALEWQSLDSVGCFDRTRILTEVGAQFGLSLEQLDAELFVDLPSAQRVLVPIDWSAERLLREYEESRIAAVLLRATRVEVTFRVTGAPEVRELFRKLKFRQLMFELESLSDGRHRLVLTGPYSLFESVTKYGLQLALSWPALRALKQMQMKADLRWGKQNENLVFNYSADAAGDRGGPVHSESPDVYRSEDLQSLFDALLLVAGNAEVADADRILELPGVGICVPDLCYREPDGTCVYLELMGYSSRKSVWDRVELVEAGLVEPVLFVASHRLRVSEELFDDVASSALYVYRGRISPSKVMTKLSALAEKQRDRLRKTPQRRARRTSPSSS
jgi:predicted nuclease of restriction endonuclease-like RecB superfamily